MLARPGRLALWLLTLSLLGPGIAPAQEAAKKDAPASTSSRRPRPFASADTPRKVERLRLFDIKHVKGEVTLDPKANKGAGEIRGTVTHTMAPLYAGLSTLTLDCGSELTVSKVTVKDGKGTRTAKFEAQPDNKLAITLDPAPASGQPIDVAISYAGTPKQGLYLVQPDAAEPGRPVCFWTQGEPDETRHWLPCYDFPNDRATSEMVVTVPKPLRVLSNGTLVETKENAGGTTTDHWKMDLPHASYLISLVATEFTIAHDKYGDLPVDYYVTRNHDEATARRAMGKTPKMLAFFEKVTGQKYPYPKYAQAVVPDFTMGGMENISATTLNEFALGDATSALERDADGLIAHELAHQWFGDLVTSRDWPHLWLNEGFASYFDPLFAEHDHGDEHFRLQMDGIVRGYLGGDTFQRRAIVESRYRNTMELFDGVTYSKGAAVLHMLRGLVGDDAWWKAVKHYVARHREQVVETDDLRRAFEESTGRDLAWFFDQWVFKGGHPELKARWRYEADDKTLRLTVEQVQNLNELTPLFRLPTTVEVDDGTKVSATAIVIDGKTQEFVIPCANPPKMVQIDPKGWIIKELDFDKPAAEWAYQLAHSRDLPGRLDAARMLAAKFKDDPAAIAALDAAWSREKDPAVRRAMVDLLGRAAEKHRAALVKAAGDDEPRVRIAALGALATLKLDAELESIFRAAWADAQGPYSARRTALRALARGKVKDRDDLIAAALQTRSYRELLASTALDLLLEDTGRKGRDAAVAFSRPDQPGPLRRGALFTLGRLAANDPSIQAPLLDLIADPSRSIRRAALLPITNAKLKAALPRLEAQLAVEPIPANRSALESAIAALKKDDKPATSSTAKATVTTTATPAQPAAAASAPKAATPTAADLADLERKAADLEQQARELRKKIDDLRPKSEPARPTPAATAK